jgi:hypothetical protein
MTATVTSSRPFESGVNSAKRGSTFRQQLTGLGGTGTVVLAWTLACIPLMQAQDAKPTEYQVKAAYLFNFARFVTWPVSATAGRPRFNICVLGRDPFGSVLDTAVEGEKIGGVPVGAKRVFRPDEAATACDVLYISSSEDDQLTGILAGMDKSSVLTVSDMPQFVKRGGMMQFVLEGNRVRFEVNLAAAQHAGLSLSSELLKLAVAVRRTP